jgi:site-specific DNA-cytosine methylase
LVNVKPLVVVSLFDGMSCGRIALDRVGIPVQIYYASEIDKHAIKVSQANYPDTVQLGNVVAVNADLFDKSPVDLLIGGSPCTGFSTAGKMLNFDDPQSKLFFEYVRLLREINPRYFLLENVVMKKEWQDIISEIVGVQPILINSKLVSAQDRKRLYWTNIPGVAVPDDLGIRFPHLCGRMVGRRINPVTGRRNDHDRDIKQVQYIETRTDGKTNCLTTVQKDNVVVRDAVQRVPASLVEFRYLTAEECEQLQTVPAGYTAAVSDSQRKKMLGNGWTVDVIAHIFSTLAEVLVNQDCESPRKAA